MKVAPIKDVGSGLENESYKGDIGIQGNNAVDGLKENEGQRDNGNSDQEISEFNGEMEREDSVNVHEKGPMLETIIIHTDTGWVSKDSGRTHVVEGGCKPSRGVRANSTSNSSRHHCKVGFDSFVSSNKENFQPIIIVEDPMNRRSIVCVDEGDTKENISEDNSYFVELPPEEEYKERKNVGVCIKSDVSEEVIVKGIKNLRIKRGWKEISEAYENNVIKRYKQVSNNDDGGVNCVVRESEVLRKLEEKGKGIKQSRSGPRKTVRRIRRVKRGVLQEIGRDT
ncbi:hypothetical protein PTKIN_Ptkin04bG0146000 [Pterospermum kingtungense]